MLQKLKKNFEKFKDEFIFASLFLDLHSDTSFYKKELNIIYISIIIILLCFIIQEIFRYKYNYSFIDLRQNKYYLNLVLIRGFFYLLPWFVVLRQTIRSIISIRKAYKILSIEIEKIRSQNLDIKMEIRKLKELKKIKN